MSDLDDLLWSLRQGPHGPQVGAFFQLDGCLLQETLTLAFLRQQQAKERPHGLLGRARQLFTPNRTPDHEDTTALWDLVRNLAGQTTEQLEKQANKLFRKLASSICPDTRELVRAHRRAGHTMVLVSSAPAFLVAPFARDLGFTHQLCTQLTYKQNKATGKLDGTPLRRAEKARAIHTLMETHSLARDLSFAYASAAQEPDFLRAVGHPVDVHYDADTRPATTTSIKGAPTLLLRPPPQPGWKEAVRTLSAIGMFQLGLTTTVGASLLVGKPLAFRYGFAKTTDAALTAAGIQMRVQGQEHLETFRPAVFIFNHQSNLDPLLVVSLVRHDITGVGKKEVTNDPRTLFLRFLNMALIDRSDPQEARASVKALVSRIRAGESVFLAPEGTRMPTPTLGPFKRGAFHLAYDAKVPLIPIVFRNTGERWPRGTPLITPGMVDVCVLPPIPTTEWSQEEIRQRADQIREMFAQTLEYWPQPPHNT